MPEDMPDRMPEDMPDRMPEDMSDRMPEDLPVTKCIDVMVGITRSKVISFFLRFGCGDAFCTDTFLHTDDVLHRSLCTEQLLRADILTQRSLCTKNLCASTPLHTEVFTQRRKYLHRDALYKDVFARINKGAWAFLHTEPFPQRNLCTEQFSHMFFYTKNI